MRFDEVWISDSQLARMEELARETKGVDGAAVEIGAWQGLSTIRLTNAIAPDRLHVVDHWLGSDDMVSQIRARDNFSIFMSNMTEGTEGNYVIHRMDWRQFVEIWKSPIRFLHLDAGHTADEVSETLQALLPLAAPGAIYAGDDWNWISVRDGVLRIFPVDRIHVYLNKLWWVVFP